MMTSMLFKLAVFTAVCAVLLPASVALAQGKPTLGELARKEQERRKAVKAAPAKVLTNKDVPKGTPVPVPAAPSDPAQAPPATTEAEKPQEAAKDEAWWRQRISQAREELRRNEMFAEALQTRINSLTNDFSSRDDPFQRATIAEERSKAILELERVKADVEAGRKKIADIEEEARKAGVLPGWLR